MSTYSKFDVVSAIIVSLFAAMLPLSAHAVERSSMLPLVTERAETLGSGRAEVIFGLDYAKDERFPYFTEPGTLRSQTRLQAPSIGFRIGAGDWAEIQADYDLIYLDETAANGQTNWQYGSGDAQLHTKVRFLKEDEVWPSMAVRFGTKLPNANRSDRLGTDDTDFDISALASKDVGPLSAHLNMGILLLGNSGGFFAPQATKAGGQDDLFTYRLGVMSAALGEPAPGAAHLHLLAEFAGQTGTHNFNDRHSARVGMQIGRGNGSIYIGTSMGLVSGSENLGVSAGFMYDFEPMKWFEDAE